MLKTLLFYLVPRFCLSPGPRTLKNGLACLRFCFIFTNIVFHTFTYIFSVYYTMRNLIGHWEVFFIIHKHCFDFFYFKKLHKIFKYFHKVQRNWFFATNLTFLIPIYKQPDGVKLWYFKLILFNLIEFIVWNI